MSTKPREQPDVSPCIATLCTGLVELLLSAKYAYDASERAKAYIQVIDYFMDFKPYRVHRPPSSLPGCVGREWGPIH